MSNILLASIANESSFAIMLMSREKHFLSEENNLGYIQEAAKYLALARKGHEIFQDFSRGQGVGISYKTKNALHAYKETKEIFGEFDDKAVSNVEAMLESVGKTNEIRGYNAEEIQFTYDFLRKICRGAMRNSTHNSCTSI